MLNQSKLYLVTINMGGFVHNKVYTLTRRESEYSNGYDYWDRSQNYGFNVDDKRKLGPYKTDGCWQFLFDSKQEAQTFLDGALAAKDFMAKTWCS